jgi:hypothetical protein
MDEMMTFTVADVQVARTDERAGGSTWTKVQAVNRRPIFISTSHVSSTVIRPGRASGGDENCDSH